jgi:hypothetical protein
VSERAEQDDDEDWLTPSAMDTQTAAHFAMMGLFPKPAEEDPDAGLSEEEKQAKRTAEFLASLKLGDAVRMKGDALVTGEDYDRIAVVTDIVDGNVSFIIRDRNDG